MTKRLSTVQAVRLCLFLALSIPLFSSNGTGTETAGKGKTQQGFPVETLRIVVAGDLLLDRGVRQRIGQVGIDGLFSPSVNTLFLSSDYVIANLECPVTAIRERVYKRFIFRGEPEWLPALYRHGITHLNLANNHSIDQGRNGLLDTQEQIRKAGMVPLGAGRNMEEAARPVLISARPRPVWVVTSLRLPLENFPYLPQKPSVSQESADSLVMRVVRLRRADRHCVILVLLHWGWEHHLRALPGQREEAHRLIDAGADAIVGHHSHTLQTTETYRGKPVYYGIGNFIFDQHRPLNTRACLVRLTITADRCKATPLPIEIRNCVPFLIRDSASAP